MTSAASTAPTSQDIAVKSLTKSLENRFSLNGVADDVLAAVGERAAAEKPVVARVLTAVTEVIVSRGETVTYPTLLSGLIATLEAKDAIDKAQVCEAVCDCLVIVASRVPRAVLSLRASRLMSMHHTVLERHSRNLSIQKSVMSNLSKVVPCLDRSSANGVRALLDVLIPAVVCAEGKGVSRMAARIVAAVLKMESLCELKSEICRRVEEIGRRAVEEPLNEAATASGVTNSKIRSRMQDALDAAVMSLIRFLSALKTLIPLTDICFVQSMLPQLWRVMTIRLPQTSAMACDVLRAVLDPNSAVQLERETVEEILLSLVQHIEGTPTENHELSLAFVETVYAGFARFHDQDPSLSMETLSCILPSLLKQLLSEFEEVRERSKQHLIFLFSAMAKRRASEEERDSGEGRMEEDSPFSKICQSMESALDTDQEDDLITLLPVVRTLFASARRPQADSLSRVMARLGALYEAFDSKATRHCSHGLPILEQSDPSEKPALLKHLEETIGSAMSHLGVVAVLDVLPLQIQEASERRADGESRTWLLPMIKRYARCDNLTDWMERLLPIAVLARQRAQQLSTSDPESEFKCATLERQIWQTLPSFCLWARDIPSGFESLSRIVGQVFVERSELQETISLAIYRLYHFPLKALKAHRARGASMDTDDGRRCSSDDITSAAADVPSHFTPELAEQSMEVLRAHSEKWFEVMASVLVATDATRGPNLLCTLSELASTSTPTVLNALFTDAKNRLFQSFQEAATDSVQQQMVSFDLLFAVVSSLDSHGLEEAIKIAELVIQSNVSYHVQKKGYKILAYILEHRRSAWIHKSQEMAKLLESTCGCCQSPSLQFRLRCIKEFLSAQFDQHTPPLDADELTVAFLPEIVLGFVDSGVKVKERAEQTLLCVGQHYSDSGRFDTLVVLLQGMLSGEEDSLTKGTIKAMQCLMERFGVLFSERLSEILDSLLRLIEQREQQMSAAPTLVALLDLIKTALQNVPRMLLNSYVEPIVRVALEWDAPMRRAREKTKALLMQLCELVGFEDVQRFVPEAYSRVMRNLRKLHRRSASQMGQTEEGTRAGGGASGTAKTRTERTKSQTNASLLKPSTTIGRSLTSKRSVLHTGRAVAQTDADDAMEEAVDLLDPAQSRKLARAAAGQETDAAVSELLEESPFELPVNSDGKLVIDDQSLKKAEKQWRKRRREALDVAAGDDAMTLKSGTPSKKSSAFGPGRSTKSRTTKPSAVHSHHSGKRFKSKKGAGGDVKGASKHEPYAYWKLDRRLLNKRRGKRSSARRDLRQLSQSKKNA